MKNEILSYKVLGIGHKQGRINFGQSDFITIIHEEFDTKTGTIQWADMLFTSGLWYQQLKLYLKTKLKRKV